MAKKLPDLTPTETNVILDVFNAILRGGDPSGLVRGRAGRNAMVKLMARRELHKAKREATVLDKPS